MRDIHNCGALFPLALHMGTPSRGAHFVHAQSARRGTASKETHDVQWRCRGDAMAIPLCAPRRQVKCGGYIQLTVKLMGETLKQ